MKTVCERYGNQLAAEGKAFVCSYECTFCAECTPQMNSGCPNCDGEFIRRPRRKLQNIEPGIGQGFRRKMRQP